MSKNKIVYVKYLDLDKDFYTLKEICSMLDLNKSFPHTACEESGIRPQQNEVGDWGFTLLASGENSQFGSGDFNQFSVG